MEVHCFLQQGGNELVIQSCRSVTDGNGAAAEHLGNDQIHHIKQPPMLILTGQHQIKPAAKPVTGTVGKLLIYKIDQYQVDLQWTECGPQSVPRSVLTLLTFNCEIYVRRNFFDNFF